MVDVGELWPQFLARIVTVYVPGIVTGYDFDVPVTVSVTWNFKPVPDRRTTHSLLGAGTLPGTVLSSHEIVRDVGDGVLAPNTMTC
mgnify:CR=1 FL=1